MQVVILRDAGNMFAGRLRAGCGARFALGHGLAYSVSAAVMAGCASGDRSSRG
jgi:hypothetical protein